MDLEDIMLSEISQIQTQILYDLTYMWNLKKKNSQKKRSDLWLPEVRDVVWENQMKMVKRHKTFNYKINKHWRYNLEHDDCS